MDFEGLSIACCLSCWNVKFIILYAWIALPWTKLWCLYLWYEIWVYCFCLFCLTHFTAQDRPAMQLYQPGARNRKRMGSGNKAFDFPPISPEHGGEHCYKTVIGTGSEKSADEWKKDHDRKKSCQYRKNTQLQPCFFVFWVICEYSALKSSVINVKWSASVRLSRIHTTSLRQIPHYLQRSDLYAFCSARNWFR